MEENSTEVNQETTKVNGLTLKQWHILKDAALMAGSFKSPSQEEFHAIVANIEKIIKDFQATSRSVRLSDKAEQRPG